MLHLNTLRLEDAERQIIEAALAQAGGVKKRAATILGISTKTLRRRQRKYLRDDTRYRQGLNPLVPSGRSNFFQNGQLGHLDKRAVNL
jgi:hypothetical protein